MNDMQKIYHLKIGLLKQESRRSDFMDSVYIAWKWIQMVHMLYG